MYLPAVFLLEVMNLMSYGLTVTLPAVLTTFVTYVAFKKTRNEQNTTLFVASYAFSRIITKKGDDELAVQRYRS